MQVNSTTNTRSYISPTLKSSQTQNTEETSEKKFDTSKPFDIDSFTFEDYKNSHGNVDLTKWIKDSNLPNEKEVLNQVNGLVSTAFYSDDDTLNEVLYDKLDNSYDNGGTWKEFIFTTLLPLADMDSSFDPITLKEIKNVPTKMENYFVNGANVFKSEDVLSNMNNFREYYNNLEGVHKKLAGDPTSTYQAFAEITAEYTKRKDEANATLDAYTRNTKQNLIEA